MLAPLLTLALSLPLGLSAQSILVDGAPQDAFATPDGGAIFVTTLRGQKRRVQAISPTPGTVLEAPRSAVFVSACAGEGAARVLWIDGQGAQNGSGQRLITAPTPFSLPDPSRLFVTEACRTTGEVRVPAGRGVAVAGPGQPLRTLAFVHQSRAYSGRHQKGLSAPPRYAVATSTYAPLLVDADVNGDGADDLVVMLQDRITVYRRDAGQLVEQPTATFSLNTRIPEVKGAELRVLVGDLSGSGRADLVVQGQRSRLPETSAIFRLESAPGRFDFTKKSTVLQSEGFVAPLAILSRKPPRLLTADADTSLVALGALVVSGSADVELTVRDKNGRRTLQGPSVSAEVDIRRGAMAGTAPVCDVDLNKDGYSDVLDFSDVGRVRLYLGTAAGVAPSVAGEARINSFQYVISLPAAHAVVVIPKSGRQVTLLTADAGGSRR